jgi:carboxymethylenebutenolidase
MRRPLEGSLISYRVADGRAEAFAADPGAHAPAVVVLHEVWGLTPHVERVCAELAGRGFAAVAPVLYWRDKALFSADNLREAMKAVWGIPIASRYDRTRLRAAVDRAKASTEVRDLLDRLYSRSYRALLLSDVLALTRGVSRNRPATAALGYSMGGGLAFRLAARSSKVSACVTFSAEPPSSKELSKIASPLLAFYGSEDRFMTKRVPQFVADALRLGKRLTLTIYPSAGHEFFAPGDRAYEPGAASDSSETMRLFLGEHLR